MGFVNLPDLGSETFRELLKIAAGKGGDERILLEGERLVTDVLESNIPVKMLIFSDDERGRQLETSLGACLPGGLSCFRLRQSSFQRLCDTKAPQGVIALSELPVRQCEARSTVPTPPWLVLDHLSDPGNVGTLLRSAEAFGFRTVIRLGGAHFRQSKVLRASMGAAMRLELYEAHSPEDVLNLAKTWKIRLFIADFGGKALESLTLSDHQNALLIGNEAHGVSLVFRDVPERVTIAMDGGESLNAGVAGSILMYEMRKLTCKL